MMLVRNLCEKSSRCLRDNGWQGIQKSGIKAVPAESAS